MFASEDWTRGLREGVSTPTASPFTLPNRLLKSLHIKSVLGKDPRDYLCD
jgi:hypothetical protein